MAYYAIFYQNILSEPFCQEIIDPVFIQFLIDNIPQLDYRNFQLLMVHLV